MQYAARVHKGTKRKATEDDYRAAMMMLDKKSKAFIGTNEYRKRMQLRMICLSYTNYVAISDVHFEALKTDK